MILTIALKPEFASSLQAEAARRGLTFEACAGQAFDEWLRAAAIEAEQDEEDADETPRLLATSDPSKRRTLADLKHSFGQ